MQISPGSTDRTILVYARDTLTGLGKTGLVAASINAQYTRVETDNDVTIAAVTEANLTALTDAHSDGGWYPVDATNAPGLYRFDIPDAAFASGAWEVVITIIDAGSNNFEIAPTRIELVSSSAPTAAEVADAVWDEDATAHQTQGTFGQAIGDPAADTNTIYAAVVTNATGATIAHDIVTVDTVVDAIKAKTDSLAFTVAGQVDANIKSVADTTVTGSGTAADPWGP